MLRIELILSRYQPILDVGEKSKVNWIGCAMVVMAVRLGSFTAGSSQSSSRNHRLIANSCSVSRILAVAVSYFVGIHVYTSCTTHTHPYILGGYSQLEKISFMDYRARETALTATPSEFQSERKWNCGSG